MVAPERALVTAIATAAVIAYLALATLVRRRALRTRGGPIASDRGLAGLLPLALPIPYLVLWIGPGPVLPVPAVLAWAGLAVVIAGPAIAAWSALTLGRHFDIEVALHPGHEVVRAGPYAHVRHPVYSGLALHLLGASLATGDLVLLAGTICGALPAFALRARAEERLLEHALGDAYTRYRREVPMLVPLPRRRSH